MSDAEAGVAPAVPVRATLCGLPKTESLKTKVAFLVPLAVGVKLTVTVQFAAGAKDDAKPEE